MNENSSRSHAVMTITLSSEQPDPEDPQVITAFERALQATDKHLDAVPFPSTSATLID